VNEFGGINNFESLFSMIVYFGLQLEEGAYPRTVGTEGGVHYFGPMGLLTMLESHLGLIGYPADNQHIRIEQFRQVLRKYLEEQGDAFYQKSYEADQLSTSAKLLQLRDSLKLSGWDFKYQANTPSRLRTIAELEQLLTKQTIDFAAGFADRFCIMLAALEHRNNPILRLFHNEPIALLPSHYRRLFELLEKHGSEVKAIPEPVIETNTNLGQFKTFLSRQSTQKISDLTADGSLFIIRARRETEAATFLAKLIQSNRNILDPVCVIPEKNRALDNAFIQEGLPSFGILSASLARPTLQILKLAPAFLWRPIDPYKIMEFVSLSLKPVDDELADLIANLMAQNPGFNGDTWRAAINNFFTVQLPARAKADKSINVDTIREQYEFWFERPRYDAQASVPKIEVIRIFEFISRWVGTTLEEQTNKNNSLIVLGEQAKRIVDLLHALPERENELTNLELERIVRTIYKPSPVNFTETALGHQPFVYKSSAIVNAIDELVWWNFSSMEREHFFSNWYDTELKYLDNIGIHLPTPKDENALLLWQRPRSILHTQGRLFLVIPEQVDGKEVFPHPLFDELQALFGDLSPITYHVNSVQQSVHCLETYFSIPGKETLPFRQLGKPKPFIRTNKAERLAERPEETFTSLENLFYYPYQWVFRYKIKLRKSSILSIVKDVTLMGNLAHRFFELFFSEKDVESRTQAEVNQWVDRKAYGLLSREGAVLLLYGREPERIAFLNKVKYAIWSLLSLIKKNDWKVLDTELKTGGNFQGVPIKGKADLVLQREKELMIVDLKWRGASRRTNMIRNEEDLQLVTYAKLLNKGNGWAHTAYFIIEKGQAIARNNLAFKEITGVPTEDNYFEINDRIYSKMEKTFIWRMQQLQSGIIEIRTEQTLPAIEDEYYDQFSNDELQSILEMKRTDAPFDDYRTLINLIE
jgi:hypothetical protein